MGQEGDLLICLLVPGLWELDSVRSSERDGEATVEGERDKSEMNLSDVYCEVKNTDPIVITMGLLV